MSEVTARFYPRPGDSNTGQGEVPDDATLEERIVFTLRTIHDPELPVNIYDLGLIYDLKLGYDGVAEIKMTLTAPGCPVAGSLPGQVEQAVRNVPGVTGARVELVWDPPWTRDRISETAKLELGLL